MLVRRAVISLTAVAGLIAASPQLQAQEKRSRKTVGDLLKRIESNTKSVKLQKQGTALPSFKKVQLAPVKRVDLYQVKPPSRSRLYYEEGTNEAELEKITDQGIKQLFKLTQQFKTSKRRGELWLRLAELYVEKSRLIEYRLQQTYDEKVRDFNEKKVAIKPRLDLKEAQDYNRRAVQLYEWFLRDFPKDPKVDQALFFLGYNYFELNQPERGKDYYARIPKEFPTSSYIEESNFALGEYYFEREQWADALKHYSAVAANKRNRLFSFALYKTAWCQYKTGAVKPALISLEKVIRAGRVAKGASDGSAGGVSRIRLATEAQKDLVVFYAEAGTPQGARSYFEEIAGNKATFGLLEKLAYYYSDTGNREGARLIFRDLIQEKPNAPKAYDYQYQIVTMYTSTDKPEVFRSELFSWIQNYSPGSQWAEANRKDKELVSRAFQLIETTLRNHILQQHQTAQNSRVPGAQKNARLGYELYFQTFKQGAKLDEMHFFYAELLFDMKEYEPAVMHYAWVTDNAPNSAYFEKSTLNTVLAAEKGLPEEAELKKNVGESLDPVALGKNVSLFVMSADRYMKAFPKGENVPAMKYKVAALFYYHNQFDHALAHFNDIIKNYPKSQYAQFAANLTLDIYNLRKDYAGLEKAGNELLANENIRNSAVGASVKGVLERASFKKAQDLEVAKDYLGAAVAYEEFAKKNPAGDLGFSASFNAAVNYERGGDLFKAIAMYSVVLADRSPKNEKIRQDSSKFIAGLLEKTGQYQKAAEAYEGYANKHPKEKDAVSFFYNAAIIRDGMNAYPQAVANYTRYMDMARGNPKFDAVFLMAKLNERRGNITRAQDFYKQYVDAGPSNAANLIEAQFNVAQINLKKGKRAEFEKGCQKVISMQKRLSKSANPVGVREAAECKYVQVSKIFDELRAIRIPANPKTQAAAVQNKLAMLNRLKEQLKAVVLYDDGPMVVNSLALIGQAYQHMAAAIYAVPVPKGLDEEGLKQYRAGVDGVAKPFQDEAVKNYEAAIDKGYKLEGYSEGLKTAQRELNRLSKDRGIDYGERAIITKITDYMGVMEQEDLGAAFKAKDERSMVEAVSKRLGKDQNDLMALNALGVFYYEQGKYGLARILLGRALKVHPNEPALHNNQGVIYLAENKQRQAIASFRKAMDIKSSYTVGAANLGSIFVEYRDYSRAADMLDNGYSAVKSDLRRGGNIGLDVANNYALALMGTGDNDRAKEIFQTILKADNGNATALLNYAILLIHRMKDKKEGEKQLNRLRFIGEDGDNRMKKAIDEMDKALGQND
jgi:TolA-binding protein/Flp pilus assembly protein TadD